MTKLHGILLTLFALVLSAGCQVQAPKKSVQNSNEEVVAILAEQAASFSAAYMRGDVSGMMDVYTKDAVIFPGNSYAITGDSLLRAYWTLPEGRRVTHHQLTATEIQVEGSTATDYGVYEVSGSNGGTEWGPVRGKYVVVWKKEGDGQWRMYLDMWNSLPQD